MNCANCGDTILVTPSNQLIHAQRQQSQCMNMNSFAYPREPECVHCAAMIYPGNIGWSHIGTGRWCDGRNLTPGNEARQATPDQDYLRFHQGIQGRISLWWIINGVRVSLPPQPRTESSRFNPEIGVNDRTRYDTYYIDRNGNRVPTQNPPSGGIPRPDGGNLPVGRGEWGDTIGRGEPNRFEIPPNMPQMVAQLQEVSRAVGGAEFLGGLIGSPVQDAGTATGSSRGNERLRQLLTQPSVIERAQGFTTPSDSIMWDEEEEGLPEGFTVMDPHKLLITAMARLSVDVPDLESDVNEFINQLEGMNTDYSNAIFEYNTAKEEYQKIPAETTRRIRIKALPLTQ